MLPKPYYESKDGRITLYCGDNRDIMPHLQERFDLVFTSPPYNLGNTTGGGFPSLGHYNSKAGVTKRGGGGKWKAASRDGGLGKGYENFDDNMPHNEYVAWQHLFLNLCWNVIGDSGAIYYNHKPRVLGGCVVLPTEYNPGLPLRQVIIWARAGGINFSPAFYVPTHEWLMLITKPDFRLKSKGASGVGDVWYVPQEESWHPAAFPIALPSRAIETTNAKCVLDPFAGSGTVLRAAKNAGIRAVGIEKSESYCAKIVNRLAQEVLPLEAS